MTEGATRMSASAASGSAGEPPRAARKTLRIGVTRENLWTFTERNVPLWDYLEFFPADAIGPRVPGDPNDPRREARPLHVDTDLGFSFDADIQFGTWVFRPRSPKQPGMMRWCKERGIEAGDTICLEERGGRNYYLYLEEKPAGESRPAG